MKNVVVICLASTIILTVIAADPIERHLLQNRAASLYVPTEAVVSGKFVEKVHVYKWSNEYRPVVRYDYVVGDRQYSSTRYWWLDPSGFSDPTGAEIALNSVTFGSAIRVFYDPDRPQDAVIDNRREALSAVVVRLAIGLGFYAIFGFSLLFAWLKSKRRASDRN